MLTRKFLMLPVEVASMTIFGFLASSLDWLTRFAAELDPIALSTGHHAAVLELIRAIIATWLSRPQT